MDDPKVLLERYELHDRLGRGGMASVYRAYDRQLQRFVAIKLFAPGTAVDGVRRRTEAALLARLSHPHLVALYDAHLAPAEDSTPSFLVMELVDGEDLRTRLERGALYPDDAAEIAAAIAEGLVVVHEAGMVHRDLKPANILLADSAVPGARPVVKLADFGIAHLIGAERLTTAGTIIGTAGYLSPEQVTGAEPGPAADIYSLGLVVLEALTGVREYPGTPVEAVAARLARDPRIPASLPEDWRGLIAAMTAKDPAVRPTALEVAVMARESAGQLAGWSPEADEPGERATEALAAGVPMASEAPALARTGGTAPTRVVDAPARRRPRRALAAGIGVGVVAVVAGSLALGSVMAPASTPAETGRTPRPTPSVTAPPSTVAPAVDTTSTVDDGQGDDQQSEPQPQQPGPAEQGPQKPAAPQPHAPGKDNPNKGPGKSSGKPGKG